MTWRNIVLSAVTASLASAQPNLHSFKIESNDLLLSRPAQAGTYFDKVGRKFAILGTESGTFEAWAYPLKLVRNAELSFFLGTSTEPVLAKEIVRTIEVSPELTTLTYTYQSFTLQVHYLTAIDQPGAYLLLDLRSTEPMTIVCSFIPVLQPMWPAGLGGQSARWLDDLKAYQISEPTRRNTAYIGSPMGSSMSYTPAHMLSDRPSQFKIVVDKPEAVRGKFIPIVIAGGRGSRDSLRTIYQKLAAEPEVHYRSALQHYRNLRSSTIRIATPNPEINLAYEWAKVAYDNLFVQNPDLGLGMVAGLGLSGTSGRPGFGWFFGGDAYINSFSLNSYGASNASRDALLFTHQWQREDGKMAHELTQAAAYVDWWKDYPYGYIHGDTSPFYVCAVWDYFRHTADSGFVRKHWSVIRKAYDWSLATDADGDGLMDNKKAGLGALEYGPLTDIQSDVYTGAVWVRASAVMPSLARVVGDTVFAQTVEAYGVNAAKSFDRRFWDERNQQYAYAFTPRGQQVDIVSPWNAVGLMWELGDPARSVKSLLKLNSAELSTDWGIRSISNKSKYYEPLNYNYGAVWPFLSSWVATAQFKHHLLLQGYATLMASVRHTFDNGLGVITEVFSGSQNIWPQEAVAHQGFSTASVVLPLMRGLAGLEVDAPRRTVQFSPHLPADWDRLVLQNINLAGSSVSFEYSRNRTKATLKVRSVGSEPVQVVFAPAFGIGTGIGKARIDGRETTYRLIVSSQTVQPLIEFLVGGETTLEVELLPTVELLPPPVLTKTGAPNRSLKILATNFKDKQLKVNVEGLAGESYELMIVNDDLLQSVSGCRREGRKLFLTMPEGPADEFVRAEFMLTVR
jgi:glycogen debranching enzyme